MGRGEVSEQDLLSDLRDLSAIVRRLMGEPGEQLRPYQMDIEIAAKLLNRAADRVANP